MLVSIASAVLQHHSVTVIVTFDTDIAAVEVTVFMRT